MIKFKLNGEEVASNAEPETPLLWVIREDFKQTGAKFGCGVGQCGACTVHVNGEARFSCVTPLAAVEGETITTIEGLSPGGDHPLQRAWIAEQTPQCGYCQSGQIMRAADLLSRNPKPTRQEIIEHMSTNICRCGTYHYILNAIERAIEEG